MDRPGTVSPPLAHPIGAHQPLRYVPLALFTVPMSLAGIGLACQRAEATAGWRPTLSNATLLFAALVLVAVTLAYGAKLLHHRDAVQADWRHPVLMCFFAPVGMTLLLLASAMLNLNMPIAVGVWLVGTVILAATSLATLSAWISRDTFQPAQLLPVLFLPIVGPTLVAQAGFRLGYVEVSWLCFSMALLLWLMFLPLVLNRLIVGPPLSEPMRPSLAILVAPPALLFISHVEVGSGLQEGGRMLFGATTLFGLLVLLRGAHLATVPFTLAWWAYSFPLAAWASATLLYSSLTGSIFYLWCGRLLLATVALITAYLLVRTLRALACGELTRPPPPGQQG